MKTVTRKTRKKTPAAPTIDLITHGSLETLEQQLQVLVTRLDRLKKENEEYRRFIENHRTGKDERLSRTEEALREHELAAARLQEMLKAREEAFQKLQALSVGQKDQIARLTLQVDALKAALQQRSRTDDETASGRSPNGEKIRQKVRAALDKLEQLEKMMQST
jgi:DNA repair exonuclease SbcCD ATPase subunit